MDEAKRAMEEQLIQEIEREKARILEEHRQKQVRRVVCIIKEGVAVSRLLYQKLTYFFKCLGGRTTIKTRPRTDY